MREKTWWRWWVVLAVLAVLAGSCTAVRGPTRSPEGSGSGGPAPGEPPICGGLARAGGWPDFSAGDDALLAPFQACASPADFVELQHGMDMPRLVGALMRAASRIRGLELAGTGAKVVDVRLGFLKDAAGRLKARVGESGLGQLARYIQYWRLR